MLPGSAPNGQLAVLTGRASSASIAAPLTADRDGWAYEVCHGAYLKGYLPEFPAGTIQMVRPATVMPAGVLLAPGGTLPSTSG